MASNTLSTLETIFLDNKKQGPPTKLKLMTEEEINEQRDGCHVWSRTCLIPNHMCCALYSDCVLFVFSFCAMALSDCFDL